MPMHIQHRRLQYSRDGPFFLPALCYQSITARSEHAGRKHYSPTFEEMPNQIRYSCTDVCNNKRLD